MSRIIVLNLSVAGCFLGWMVWFGPTFGNRCAAHYPDKSEKWEACVHRLDNGDGIHFVRKIELVPVE